jgi:tRNA G10  N-methylase Trm11
LSSVKKPNLIITDLPYGIQHHGELSGLIGEALPVWSNLLLPGGAMAMSWDSTRFPRADMIVLVQASSPMTVLDDPPYNQLAHRVDRVIKQRDILVARKATNEANETLALP